MQVESISVEKRPSYDSDYPNQLVGTVTLKGMSGTQTMRLSPGALSRMFKVIAQEVQETAQANAALVKNGMRDAADACLVLESSTIGAITND